MSYDPKDLRICPGCQGSFFFCADEWSIDDGKCRACVAKDFTAKASATMVITNGEPPPAPFKRTVCSCPRCVDCCRRPGPLHPDDVGKIAMALGGTVADVADYLCASPGARVQKGDKAFTVGTITPKTIRGRCVFLTPDDKCSIHEVAPFGCSHFDMHMRPSEGNRRSKWLHEEIAKSSTYKKLRDALPLAQNYKAR